MGRGRRLILRIVVGVFGLVVVSVGTALLYALYAYDRAWNPPLPEIHASSDSAVIARGEYLVFGPGHCADCHSSPADREALFAGEIVPLVGGIEEDTWLGSWMAPNLTPDRETGIGAVTDGEFARMMRHGVNRFDRIALPFKDSFADLAEADLVAILSYLRTLPPMPGPGPGSEVNLWGKLTLSYFLEPYGPAEPPPASLAPDTTAAYGGYLANTVARCGSCHTPRNLKTGEYLGPRFSGGLPFESRENLGTIYLTPNLTPDPQTGHLVGWSEEAFVARMRAGAAIADSPMPWGGYRRMTEGDLRAVYRYLMSLEPVRNETGPIVQRPG